MKKYKIDYHATEYLNSKKFEYNTLEEAKKQVETMLKDGKEYLWLRIIERIIVEEYV